MVWSASPPGCQVSSATGFRMVATFAISAERRMDAVT
jgi:hypothetical protein